MIIVFFLPLYFCLTEELSAQPDTQLWGNLILTWQKNPRFSYELDFEPKVLISAPSTEPGWHSLDLTQTFDYAAEKWLDLTGEIVTGYTKQTDDVNSFELTPRVGVRFHLFSNRITPLLKEKSPKRRLIIRDLIRLEYRNLFYTNNQGTDSAWRARNRLEFLFPINHHNITHDHTLYTLADWEWFLPINDVKERFANKQRIRTGFGYRKNFNWILEALYIWTRSRKNADENFTTSDNIIDFRVKYRF